MKAKSKGQRKVGKVMREYKGREPALVIRRQGAQAQAGGGHRAERSAPGQRAHSQKRKRRAA